MIEDANLRVVLVQMSAGSRSVEEPCGQPDDDGLLEQDVRTMNNSED